MGKMKQIAEMIRNNDVERLRRAIKASTDANRDYVYFIGKKYSVADANQILLFMYHEEAKYNQIRRAERALEHIENPDSKS